MNLAASHENPVFYIDEKLTVNIQEGNEFMTVRLSSTDPNEATTLVKALVASYMGEVVYAEDRSHKGELAKLEKAYNEAAANLEEKKASYIKNAKLHGLQIGTSNSDTPTLTQLQLQVLEDLRDTKQARNQNRGELIRVEAMLDTAMMPRLRQSRSSSSRTRKSTRLPKRIPRRRNWTSAFDRCKELIQSYLDNAQNPEGEPTYRAAVRLKAELEEKYAKHRADVKAEVLRQYDERLNEDHDLTAVAMRRQIQSLKKLIGDQEKQVEELTAKAAQFPGSIIELDSQRSEIRRLEGIVDSLGVQREKFAWKPTPRRASPRRRTPSWRSETPRSKSRQLSRPPSRCSSWCA